MLLGKIVIGADTENALWHQPEGPGLQAIAEGFRHLGCPDDHATNAAESIVYDALYAYCQAMVRQGNQWRVPGLTSGCCLPHASRAVCLWLLSIVLVRSVVEAGLGEGELVFY